MRTTSRAFAATAGLALMLTACGGGESTPAEPDAGASPDAASTEAPARGDADLVIWTDELKIVPIREIADQFAADNGITVDVQAVSANLQTNFVTANAAGNGPDVVVGAHDWIGNMVQNGAIDPLQLTPDQLGAYSDVAVEATTYNDSLYGLPYGVEALVLYRNTDIVPEAPNTLDEAFAAGEAAVAAGQVEAPFSLPQGDVGDAYHMQPLYTSMGGVIFGEGPDGQSDPSQLGIGEPGSIAAAQKIFELGESGRGILRRSISNDNSISLFAEGRAPFLVSGPWALSDVEGSGINYAVSPIPGFEGQQPAVPFTGVQAFYVASQGQNKAFAQEFIANAMNTEEAMQTMYEGANLPPAMTSVQESAAAGNEQLGVFVEAAQGGDPMPAIPAMTAVFEPLGQAYAAIIGGADPADTMTKTGETISSAISAG